MVAWSQHVVQFISLVSDLNITSKLIEAPIGWNETGANFFISGKAIDLPAIAITISIVIVLLIGIRETSIVNIILVVIKVIILLIFIFACCKYVHRENFMPFIPKNKGILPCV